MSLVAEVIRSLGFEASEEDVNTNQGQELNDQKTEDSHKDNRNEIELEAAPAVTEEPLVATHVGWLSPDGVLHPLTADAATHSNAARIQHGSTYIQLIADGWARVDESGAELGDLEKITDPQWRTLEDDLYSRSEDMIFDFKSKKGKTTLAVESSDLSDAGLNLEDYLKGAASLARVSKKKAARVKAWLEKRAEDKVKMTVTIADLPIDIEWPKGSTRKFKGSDNEVEMTASYGRIPATEGMDSEELDVYLGDHPESRKVFKMQQLKKDGTFDEEKFFVGYESEKEAEKSYESMMPKELNGGFTEMSWDQFMKLVKHEQKKEDVIETPKDEMVQEHERLVDVLKSPSHEDDLEEAKEQKQELKEYKEASFQVEALVIEKMIDGVPEKLTVQPVYDIETEQIDHYDVFDTAGVRIVQAPNPTGEMLSASEIDSIVYNELGRMRGIEGNLTLTAETCMSCGKEFQPEIMEEKSTTDPASESGYHISKNCPECREKALEEFRRPHEPSGKTSELYRRQKKAIEHRFQGAFRRKAHQTQASEEIMSTKHYVKGKFDLERNAFLISVDGNETVVDSAGSAESVIQRVASQSEASAFVGRMTGHVGIEQEAVLEKEANEPVPTIYEEQGSVGSNKPGSAKTPSMPEIEAASGKFYFGFVRGENGQAGFAKVTDNIDAVPPDATHMEILTDREEAAQLLTNYQAAGHTVEWDVDLPRTTEAKSKHIDADHDYIGKGKVYCKKVGDSFDLGQMGLDSNGVRTVCPFCGAELSEAILQEVQEMESPELDV